MRDKSIIQSIEKAAAILKLFNKNEPMLTLHDIHIKTGYTKTTAMRFCNTLCKIGFLEKVYVGKIPYYRLGIELFTIGSQVMHAIDLPSRAKKYLTDISNKLGDNSYLFIERNNQAYCIETVKGEYFIQANTTHIGDVLPLNRGGGPLAILAYMDSERQAEVFELLKLSKEKTEALKNRLVRIREKGYSFSSNETYQNTAAIGVPIFNHLGSVVAAFSVGGIEQRFSNERFPEIVKITKEAANNLSREMGLQK